MKQKRPIQVKAAILLYVFSLNTLLGFACSVGFNMGYNQNHHHDAELGVTSQTEQQHHGSHHNHRADTKHSTPNEESSKDDCCGNNVTSFNLLDKSVAEQVHFVHPAPVITSSSTFFYIGMSQPHFVPINTRNFARNYHPPIPDIRIAIRSFLI